MGKGCYGDEGATSSCPHVCPAGKWSSEGFAKCLDLDEGCIGEEGSTESCPTPCAKGFYTLNHLKCDLCRDGTYSSNPRSSSCSPVDAGELETIK